MPWTVGDPPSCAKNWTQEQKKKCVDAANAVLRDGGTEEQAIFACIRNAGKTKHPGGKEARGEGVGVGGEKQGDGGADICVCPKCGAKIEHKRGTPCNEVKCPKCGEMMSGKEAGFEGWYDSLDEDTQQLLEDHIHGLKSALQKERQARKDLEKQTKGKEAEAEEILGDIIPLVEKAFAEDGTIPIKIMQPGWGQSGYYPTEVLERDGPKVFTDGLQMFWDHPTETEERERPERSLRDLAGKLTEDARFDADGPFGAGLYSQAEVFGPFKDSVEELAPHIGLSIFAKGRAAEGEAEGREGMIIEEITSGRSVDFVTVPGAGGQILQLFESARGKPAPNKKREAEMADEKLKEAFEELEKERDQLKQKSEADEAENARLREALLLRKAKDMASGMLAEQDIPEMTRTRIAEGVSKNPPVKDGELDEEGFKEAIEKSVKDEMAYLATLSESGAIRGMGDSETPTDEGDAETLMESFIAYFEAKGESAEMAEKMAEKAVRGR